MRDLEELLKVYNLHCLLDHSPGAELSCAAVVRLARSAITAKAFQCRVAGYFSSLRWGKRVGADGGMSGISDKIGGYIDARSRREKIYKTKAPDAVS